MTASPDVLQKLIRQGYVEKDSEGKYQITPRGIRRVETRALDELFDVSSRDKMGKHETDMRGVGQTIFCGNFFDGASALTLPVGFARGMAVSAEGIIYFSGCGGQTWRINSSFSTECLPAQI